MKSPCPRYSLSELSMVESPDLPTRSLQDIVSDDERSLRKLREFPYGDDWTPRRFSKSERHENNQSCDCNCGLPNKKYCMLTNVSKKGHSSRKKIVWAPMSICKVL
ncbi:hypothetical protein ACF0H5_005457 [Mactra antiquata]